MRPITPSGISNQDELNKSFYRTLVGNISPGAPISFDNIGQPLVFKPDNTAGCIIRVGSTANLNGLPNAWAGPNVDLTINHGLNTVPYGFIVIAKYAPADVFFGTLAPSAQTITLQTTNAATDTTIWILA